MKLFYNKAFLTEGSDQIVTTESEIKPVISRVRRGSRVDKQ